jgi:hypothetical protein
MSDREHKINAPFDHKFSEFKGVVIDGANVLTKGRGKEKQFVIQRLTKLKQIVEGLGWSALIGLKEKSYYYMINKKSGMPDEDKRQLTEFRDTGVIDLIDDEEDDYHLISVALNGPYYLLSHDKYRDWKKNNPKLKSHIEQCYIRIQWLGDEPSVNLPSNGKSTVVASNDSSIDESLILMHTNSEQAVLAPYEKNIGRNWLSSKFDLESKQYISGQHFRFRILNGQLTIEDLSSKNGTYINNLRLPPNHPNELQIGTVFKIGKDDEFKVMKI